MEENITTIDPNLVNPEPTDVVVAPQEVDPNAVSVEDEPTGISSTQARSQFETDQTELQKIAEQLEQARLQAEKIKETAEKIEQEQRIGLVLINPDTGQERRIGNPELNRNQISNLLQSGFVVQEGELPAGITETGEADDSPESQLTQEAARIEAELDKITAEEEQLIQQQQRAIDEALKNTIQTIRDQYDVRRKELKDLNKRSLESFRQLGFRLGTARFSPITATGILTTEEANGIRRLAELDAEEQELLNAAKNAAQERNAELLNEKMESIREKRNQRQTQLEELRKQAIEQAEEIKQKKLEINDEAKVINSHNKGNTTIAEVFADINFDNEGNPMERQISVEKISSILDETIRTPDLLTPAEAERLGVPYGTTKTAAAKLGIIPGESGSLSSITGLEETQLADVIKENPFLFHQLTPSKKAEVIPSLAEKGFEFPRDLGSVERRAQNNANAALTQIANMENMMFEPDGSINNLVIANPIGEFAFARNEVLDIISRLRTGAALTPSEEDFYQRQLPKFYNSEDVVKEKMQHWKALFAGMSGANVILQTEDGEVFEAKDMFDSNTRADVRNLISDGATILKIR